MNHFKNKIFDEFDKNLTRILGLTFEEYESMFKKHGDSPLDEFRDTHNNEGADAARFAMNWSIVHLSVIYQERARPENDHIGDKRTCNKPRPRAGALLGKLEPSIVRNLGHYFTVTIPITKKILTFNVWLIPLAQRLDTRLTEQT